MIWETYLLYALPLAARLALGGAVAWADVALSQASMLVVFPSTFLPLVVPDPRREHEYRHALYALAFTLAVLTAVRLDRLEGPFLSFCVLGQLTLWWFVLSHWLENHVDPRIRTHQGDISVLPLTLVAIATFVIDVPTDAFRFARSTVFFVPVIVAWATMFFIAFQDFARQCVTTHEHPAFMYYAYASLVIAVVHLLLIETGADAHTYQFFPIVAALFCQCIPDPARRPVPRPRRRVATLVCVAATSLALFYAAMRFRVQEAGVFLAANACAALVLPLANGERWVEPGCLLCTLASRNLYASADAWYDPAAIGACHYLVLRATDWLVRPVVRTAGGEDLRGATLVFDGRTRRGRVARACPPRRLHVLEEARGRARVATWTVPVLRLGYAEHEVALQTRDEERGEVRAIVA